MNLFKEAHFTPPEEEVEFMCVLRRDRQFLQAYSKMPACKRFSQKDSEAQQRYKRISEVMLYFIKNFHLAFCGS